MKNLARKNIQDIIPYEPGKPIEELERELGIKDVVKLASNENPIGPSPKALKALSKAITGINRYPDGACFYLKKKLASWLKVKPENLTIANGSDEIIDIIIKAFLENDDEVLVAEHAFLEYSILSKTRGVKVNTVRLKNFNYDIPAIVDCVNKNNGIKVIFLGNPDNPTGAYLNSRMLDKLINGCPDNRLVVIDEAYRELVDAKDYSQPFKYLPDYAGQAGLGKKNIVIMRTFSKAYGLAGLRIGYAISNKGIAASMEKVRLPFNVNLLAQKAAIAALDDKEHILKTVQVIKEGKKFLVENLKDLGLDIVVSPANFILVNCGKDKGRDIFNKLLRRGVIVRDMQAYDLANYFRVNVGTMEENKRFIEALKKVKCSLKFDV